MRRAKINFDHAMLDRLCHELRSMGVDAKAAREELLEEVDRDSDDDDTSMGLVEINKSPIRWIHLLNSRGEIQSQSFDTNYIEYLVPDSRHLPDDLYIILKCVRRFPVVGRIIDVKWRIFLSGGLSGRQRLELVHYLTNDEVLKTATLSSKSFQNKFVAIETRPRFGYWKITSSGGGKYPFEFPTPSPDEWLCYEKVAACLLKAPIPA